MLIASLTATVCVSTNACWGAGGTHARGGAGLRGSLTPTAVWMGVPVSLTLTHEQMGGNGDDEGINTLVAVGVSSR